MESKSCQHLVHTGHPRSLPDTDGGEVAPPLLDEHTIFGSAEALPGITAGLPQENPEAWLFAMTQSTSLSAVLLLHKPSRFLIRQPLAGLLVRKVPEVPGLRHVVR